MMRKRNQPQIIARETVTLRKTGFNCCCDAGVGQLSCTRLNSAPDCSLRGTSSNVLCPISAQKRFWFNPDTPLYSTESPPILKPSPSLPRPNSMRESSCYSSRIISTATPAHLDAENLPAPKKSQAKCTQTRSTLEPSVQTFWVITKFSWRFPTLDV